MGNHNCSWENSLWMVIFYSYVKLPEGKCLEVIFEFMKSWPVELRVCVKVYRCRSHMIRFENCRIPQGPKSLTDPSRVEDQRKLWWQSLQPNVFETRNNDNLIGSMLCQVSGPQTSTPYIINGYFGHFMTWWSQVSHSPDWWFTGVSTSCPGFNMGLLRGYPLVI